MEISVHRYLSREVLKCFLISVLVIIGTFPDNDWSFTTGLDSPLLWVFNNLYANGLGAGKEIIFPHGPLAFFMYPLPANIIVSTLISSILKALLVFNVCWLYPETNNQLKWPVSFIFAYIISIIAGFHYLILANILLLYCNYFPERKKVYKILAFFITAFGFYVKAYVAIVSGTLFLSFVLYFLYSTKKIKYFLLDCIYLSAFILMFWFLMYRTFSGVFRYLWGVFQLSLDNSSAVANYPYNNWFILTLLLILIVAILFFNRSKKSIFYGILVSLSLFAAWKHGMAREDIFHTKGLYIYLIISLSVFIIFYKKDIWLKLVLSVLAVFLFSINMKNSINNFSPKYELCKINNFYEFISKFKQLKENSLNMTQSQIAGKKLPQKILDTISNSTVDVYPWDYSIIPANNLKWQPRVVLHSYASYTSWLDRKNAEHFSSNKSPEYLFIEKNKWSNVNGGEFTSIDSRYFLNDEPNTILSLIQNYDFSDSESNFLMLKRREKTVQVIKKEISSNVVTWGAWIDVPESKGSLMRAKLNFSKSFLERVKSFVYKDEQFWIYLQLHNGSIHKYRIVPKNAVDGIWINPYLFTFDKAYSVDKILFKCSNQSILVKNLTVSWEQIMFNEPDRINRFFNTKITSDSVLYYSTIDYENPGVDNWTNVNSNAVTNNSFEGLKSQLIKPNGISSAFTFNMDSILFQDLKITADCWVKSPDYKLSKDISLILLIDDNKGNIIKTAIPIDDQLTDGTQWNNIFNFIDYKHYSRNCTFKSYLLNKSSKDVLVDNFRIMIMNATLL